MAMKVKTRTRHRVRRVVRCPFRCGSRSSVRTRWRAPNDLSEALTAFGRALRAHRQLARLAPSFFDAAVVDRERENREAQRAWMEFWEPYLAKAYGVPPQPVELDDDLPRLPGPQTRRAVERRLAEWQLWMEAGKAAMTRHRQRHPHALPTFSQLARLLDVAFAFKALALGLDSPNPLPEKITYDYEFKDLKRAYGNKAEPEPSPEPGAGFQPGGPMQIPERSPAQLVPPTPKPTPVPPVVPTPPRPARCDGFSRYARLLRTQAGYVKR